jgi:amino acid adenylation domain-containing protein/thioester reductase-like protein
MPAFDLFQALTPESKRALLAHLLEIRAAGEMAVSPPSHGQRALWLVHQLDPDSAAYNVAIAARVESGLDPAALRRTLQTLVDRHASLRTTFTAWDGLPLQRVHRHATVSLTEVDATSWTEQRLRETLRGLGHRPFDLEHGPLLRAHLFQRPAGAQVLLLTVHHIVFDVVSLVVLLDELATSYAAIIAGTGPVLRSGGASYVDYVGWQARLLDGPEGERQWNYWRERLTPPPAPLDLPLDRQRPPMATVRGADFPFSLSPDLTAAVRALARSRHATLYTVLLAAFNVLLHRYSGQSDVTVGSPFVGRSSAEFEGTVGYFINPVVLRSDCSADPPFTEFLGQVRRTVLGALEHQDFPLSLLVERLRPDRDPSRSPLFQVMFNMPKANRLEEQSLAQFLLGTAGARMDLGGLPVELFPVEQQVAMFDLLLGMVDAGPSISASMQFNTDLFNVSTIERMVHHFRVLLADLAADPSRRLSEFALLTDADRERLVAAPGTRELVASAEDGAAGWAGFVERFEAQVRARPDAVAVSVADQGAGGDPPGATEVTYLELDRRAGAVARTVGDHGLGRDDLVAVLADRGVDLLAAIIGVLRAGAAYLPLEPRGPAIRLGRILRDARPSLVLTSRGLAPLLAGAGVPAPHPPRRLLEDLLEHLPEERFEDRSEDLPEDVVAADPAGVRSVPVRPGDLAYVIYTSGSTGTPKGAMVEHLGMVNHLWAKVEDLAISERDVLAQTASQCFDISVWQFLAPLTVGGRVHIMPDEIAHDPARLLTETAAAGVTILETVPSMLAAMLAEADRRGRAAPSLGRLRWMMSTGEELWPGLCNDWFERFPAVPIVNAYGPTECSDDVTHHVLRERLAPGVARVPVGRPILNTRIYIVDPNLRVVPENVVGELCVGGPGVGRGYLNDPERTARAFLPDPFGAPGDRLYRTGDLGRYRADGEIEVLGRIDRQVKIRGNRIELGEVESALADHPDVREAVVAVHGPAGEDRVLVAYVTAAPVLAPAELLRWAGQRLPSAMVPAAILPLDRIPRTPNGKVDRNALPTPDLGGGPGGAGRDVVFSPSEARVAEVWRAVLRRDRVGPHDSFFELGGHSLQATQALAALREAWQVELPLRAFMENPTVAGIAAALDDHHRQPAGAAEPAGVPVRRLAPDGRLDSAIVPAALRPASRALRRVLLTGATGFLGAHLADVLRGETAADVVCLVRASDDDAALDRLRHALKVHGLPFDELGGRVTAVAGDLGKARLGLSDRVYEQLAASVDTIVHSGAQVDLLRPYSALRAVNVSGTEEVIRFACHRVTKELHLISTIAMLGGAGGGRVSETDPLDGVQPLLDGYTQSKWVAEAKAAAASERGLPVSVYRPGRVSGDSRTGIGQQDDLILPILRLAIGQGRAPDLDAPVDLTPVDYVSRAVVQLVRDGVCAIPAHLANPAPARLSDVIDWVRSYGYPLGTVPPDQWLAEAAAAAGPGEAIAGLLGQRLQPGQSPVIDSERTRARLRPSGLTCPPVDEGLVHTYLDHWVAEGLLPPPPRPRDV